MVYGVGRHSQIGAFPFIDGARDNWNKGHPRVFREEIDGHEHNALLYILENLAKKSLLKLLTIQGKLKDRGNQLDHLHPLTFFLGILSHPNLRNYFYELRNKNNKAWKEFVKGAINSFNEEKRGQNIQDHHIEAFCRRLNKDPNHIRHLMHIGNWDGFLRDL